MKTINLKIIFVLMIATVSATSLYAQDLVITFFGDTIPCRIAQMDSISVTFQTVRKDGSKEVRILARQFVTDFRKEQQNIANPAEIEESEGKPVTASTVVVTGSRPVAVTRPKPEYTSFRWAFASGYAKRLSAIPQVKRSSDDYLKLFEKLINGFSWESEMQFFLNKRNALALHVSGVHAAVSKDGSVTVSGESFYDYKLRQRMMYVGPAWVRMYETKQFLFSSSLSPGVFIFTEKQWPYKSVPNPNKYHSAAGAIHCGIGGECKLSPSCAIGLKLGITLDSVSLFNIGEPAFKSQIPVSWSSFILAGYISFRN